MKKLMRYFALSLMLCFIFLPATKVKADNNVWVTSYSAGEITVQWNKLNESQLTQLISGKTEGTKLNYYIGIGTSEDAANANAINNNVTDRNAFTFQNLEAGTTYVVKLKYIIVEPAHKDAAGKDVPATVVDASTLVSYASASALTKPNVPTNVRATFWSLDRDKLVVEWDQVGNASGYIVSFEDSDGDKATKEVTERKLELNTEETRYFKIRVKAFVKTADGNTREESDYSEQAYTFAQPLINETDDGYDVQIKNKTMMLSWERIKEATGYEVYVGTKKNGKYTKVKTIKNNRTTSAKIKYYNGKRFSPKKEYYVYVICYRTSKGKTTRTTSSYVVNYRKGDTYLTLKRN